MSSRNFTSWNTKDCYAENVLKTLSRRVLKKSSRLLRNQKNIRLKSIRMNQSSTEPFKLYNGNAKAELDLLNYIKEEQALIHLHWYQKQIWLA